MFHIHDGRMHYIYPTQTPLSTHAHNYSLAFMYFSIVCPQMIFSFSVSHSLAYDIKRFPTRRFIMLMFKPMYGIVLGIS